MREMIGARAFWSEAVGRPLCKFGRFCLAGGRLQARNRCHQCPRAIIAALQL